jgi:hypothetical protein
MSGDRSPWWYSGDEQPPGPQEAATEASGSEASGSDEPSARPLVPDWLGLLSGAQRLVEWAADAVLTPHAEHDDPSAHPQCLLCRASLLLGDGRRGAGDPGPEGDPADPGAAGTDGSTGSGIRWLPIRD